VPLTLNGSPDPLFDRIRELRLDPNRRTSISKFEYDIFPLAPPVPVKVLEDAERRLGFPLPPLLRRLYTEIGNGGFGPGHGLAQYDSIRVGSQPPGRSAKVFTICDWGCANWSAIDCSTEEREMIFSHDRPDLCDEIREGISFRQWMQDWADGVDRWARVYPETKGERFSR
jgi:hypothetical protein